MKEWTADDDTTILRLLSQGRTRKQIAVHFGVTRNAICGRVHRLNKSAPECTASQNIAEGDPVVTPGCTGADTPTSGYFVIRKGRMWVATSWRWFTDPDFTMKGISFDRAEAIELFRTSKLFRWGVQTTAAPDASEFKDWTAAV